MKSAKLRTIPLVLLEAARGFRRDEGFTLSSSLAFYSTIALIPAIFLLTYVNTLSEGFSQLMVIKTSDILRELIPSYSTGVLERLLAITGPTRTLGALNLVILFWSITPLLNALRTAFNTVFKVDRKRNFLIHKIFDLLLIAVFISLFSAIASMGVLFQLLPSYEDYPQLSTVVPFFSMWLVLFLTFLTFCPRSAPRHLIFGAFVSTMLWFTLRPLFNLFLTYNAGFGLTFGSLKSLFVVVLWIYLSQCMVLYGAEVTAALRRKESIYIKCLLEGKGNVPRRIRRDLVLPMAKDTVLFREGDEGVNMYYVLSGSVYVWKNNQVVSAILTGNFFGEMSFLLQERRTATVTTAEESSLLMISRDNFDNLTREYPNLLLDMLLEMANRLKNTTDLL